MRHFPCIPKYWVGCRVAPFFPTLLYSLIIVLQSLLLTDGGKKAFNVDRRTYFMSEAFLSECKLRWNSSLTFALIAAESSVTLLVMKLANYEYLDSYVRHFLHLAEWRLPDDCPAKRASEPDYIFSLHVFHT